MTNVVDDNLNAVLKTLRPSERRSIEDHLRGEKTPESFELIRQLRRKLKKKVRNRVRRYLWLA